MSCGDKSVSSTSNNINLLSEAISLKVFLFLIFSTKKDNCLLLIIIFLIINKYPLDITCVLNKILLSL